MQYLILLAVVSMMVLYVLIIVGCLCYVERHGRRTSQSPPLLLNDRGRFARVNGYEHSLKSPAWSCVSITWSAASRRRKAVLLAVRMKS